MRIGIMGGTFDPVHNAHLLMAREALREFSLEGLTMVPSFHPPHKEIREVAPYQRRFDMMALALEFEDRVFASGAEADRGGVSYTADTLRHFRKEFPGANLFFVIGGDTLFELENWKTPEEVLSLATFVVFRRGDAREGWDDTLRRLREKYGNGILVVHALIPDISSSCIRQRVREGQSIRGLVPRRVERYILENGIYKG